MESEISRDSYDEIKKKTKSYCEQINRELEGIKNTSPEDQASIKGKQEKVAINLKKLLKYLVSLQIDSYGFTYGSNHTSQNLDYDIVDYLRSTVELYASENQNADEPEEKTVDIGEAFTAYYIFAYMYHLYDPNSLQLFIDTYENLFWEKYALVYQIRGRELRTQGQFWDAAKNDEIALRVLKTKNIENIGVKVTYASSIALALESQNYNIDESYVKQALDNVNQAIQINRTYARYHYLSAKLRLYWVKKQVYEKIKNGLDCDTDNANWENDLATAEKSIQEALNLLDERSPSYMGFFVDYSITLSQIKRTRSDIQLIQNIQIYYNDKSQIFHNNIKEMTDKSFDDWNKNLSSEMQEKVQHYLSEEHKSIQKELKETQTRFMEIMAIFVAIVGVMMTMIELLSQGYKIQEVLVGMVVMNSGILMVYSFFKMIISEKITRFLIATIFFAFLIILISFKLSTSIP